MNSLKEWWDRVREEWVKLKPELTFALGARDGGSIEIEIEWIDETIEHEEEQSMLAWLKYIHEESPHDWTGRAVLEELIAAYSSVYPRFSFESEEKDGRVIVKIKSKTGANEDYHGQIVMNSDQAKVFLNSFYGDDEPPVA